MTARRPRRLARMLLEQIEARPRFRRAIVRRLDRIPGLKRALKRELGRMRAETAGGAALAAAALRPEGLTARAARVLADLDRARAAHATDRAEHGR